MRSVPMRCATAITRCMWRMRRPIPGSTRPTKHIFTQRPYTICVLAANTPNPNWSSRAAVRIADRQHTQPAMAQRRLTTVIALLAVKNTQRAIDVLVQPTAVFVSGCNSQHCTLVVNLYPRPVRGYFKRIFCEVVL